MGKRAKVLFAVAIVLLTLAGPARANDDLGQTRTVRTGSLGRRWGRHAYGVIVTPERRQKVLFTPAIESNVKQVIVTGPKAPSIANSGGLSGKEVYVNPLSVYYENLKGLSEGFQRAGRPPILVKAADAKRAKL